MEPSPLAYVHFLDADLGFSRSATPFGRAIRFFERSLGEPPSEANHVFGITKGSPAPEITEATVKLGVITRNLHVAYPWDNRDQVGFAIARATNLTDEQRSSIARRAARYHGRPYGKAKILLYALGLGALTFRDKSPVCHWVWSKSYATEGFYFGTAPNQATPDTMFDYVQTEIGSNYTWVVPPTWRGETDE